MKTTCFFFLTLGWFLQASAQISECEGITSEVNKLVKESNFADAYSLWADSGKCSAANETIYSDGEIVLQYKIDNAASAEEKADFISKTVKLYDNFDKNFPGNAKSHLVKKAMLFKRYKTAEEPEIFALLDKAFKNDRSNFTDANALYVYFDMYFKQFKAGDKNITEDDLFKKYDAVTAHLSSLATGENAERRNYKTASDGLKNLMSPVVTCEKLIAFYGKDFEAGKTDVAWLESASVSLAAKNCTADKLFLSIAEQWYKLAPTAKSAYNLGLANMRNKNREKGIEYFDIAAGLETEPAAKAKTYYTIATGLTVSDKPQAMSYLKKSIATKKDYGKAYLLMAQMYSNASECGETPFEKKALYILAANTARKAGEVDATMKKISLMQAKKYSDKGPTSAEIKEAKMSKKKITYKCWINETVVVPES